MTGPLPGTRNWRITHSLWVLPAFACGLLTWTSFLFIGARTKTRIWTISAVVYLIGIVGAIVLMGMSGPTESEVAAGATPPTATQQAYSDWGAGLLIAVWLAGITHALLARPHYLHKLAQTEQRQPLVPVYPGATDRSAAPDWVGVDPRQFWGPPTSTPQPPVSVPPSARPTPVSAPPVLAKTSTRVAVNNAGAPELATLGLSTGAATAVLAARERSGGFRDVRDFAAAAGLKPHELVRITDRLDFADAAPTRATPSMGRRLDL
ncbi:ComEA family DNA-binding protein [Nocardia sp. FBN12]|uniref:ComEA family DNA-binding protein n=1 Tax=Nocardia sp. FBN12 TaxID=3419766 RepID=UPI003D030CD1